MQTFLPIFYVLPKFCMETPCVRPCEGHKYGGQSLVIKSEYSSLENSLTLKSKLKACSENKISEDESFLSYMPEFFGRHFIVMSHESLEIPTCSIIKRKTLKK